MMKYPSGPAFYKDQDFYVPSFDIKVGEKPLEREVIRDITSVTYRDSLDQIDSFEITVNNWDAEKRDFKYSDGPIFDPGNKLELWMGYYPSIGSKDGLKKMLTGEITSLRPSFPAQGQPTLVVSGLNLLHKLREKQISRAYPRKTDSQIAEEIRKRLKIKLDFDKNDDALNQEYPYLFQDNMYDIVYLLIRAHRIGFELFVDEKASKGSQRPVKLIYKASTEINLKVFELKYGLTLIEFSPELTTANQVGKVTVKGWDALNKKPISKTVTLEQLKTKGILNKKGQEKLKSGFADREEVITNIPIHDEREAERIARETLQANVKNMVKGSGSVVGLPELRTGSILNLLGMGDRFDGSYFVTGTTHTIGDGGYTTRFECRME